MLTCVCPLMLYDHIFGVGLEVAELALEALDLDAVLAGHVDAQLDLRGEDVAALRAEDARGESTLGASVMLDVHVVPSEGAHCVLIILIPTASEVYLFPMGCVLYSTGHKKKRHGEQIVRFFSDF